MYVFVVMAPQSLLCCKHKKKTYIFKNAMIWNVQDFQVLQLNWTNRKMEGGTGAGRIDTSIDSQVMDMDSDDDAFLLEAYEVFETI